MKTESKQITAKYKVPKEVIEIFKMMNIPYQDEIIINEYHDIQIAESVDEAIKGNDKAKGLSQTAADKMILTKFQTNQYDKIRPKLAEKAAAKFAAAAKKHLTT